MVLCMLVYYVYHYVSRRYLDMRHNGLRVTLFIINYYY